jgi:SAM-dependent methyltransferase
MTIKYWSEINPKHKYFVNQSENLFESTKEAFEILKKKKLINLNTLDLACGNGENLFFLKKKYNNKKYCLGLDFNKKLIKLCSKYNHFKNLEFKYGNILKLNKNLIDKFKLITSFQTLSWLNNYEKASLEMIKLNSDFIFISSLFWEGLIDFNIKLNILKNKNWPKQKLYSKYYNIYSLNNFLSFYKKNNYKTILCKRFLIKKTLKNNFNYNMGTYTIKNKKKNIQISGPLIMNWYFIIFKKINE